MDYFYVKQRLTPVELKEIKIDINKTKHFLERTRRLQIYNEELKLDNEKIIDGFIIDKNHINGDEIHLISNKALIHILNKSTGRYITVLAARPGQLKRYYNKLRIPVKVEVKNLLNLAYENSYKGLNNK